MTYSTVAFAGAALDTTAWQPYNGPGNNGIGTRTPAAISVANGICTIAGTKATGTTGGMSHSLRGKTYGTWDVQARVDAGNGWWPCFGLWPDSNSNTADGEIDITEIPTGARTAAVQTVHYGPSGVQKSLTSPLDGTQWHTYGVQWSATELVFMIDGTPTLTITDPLLIPQNPMFFFVQLDEGPSPNWVPAPDASTPAVVNLQLAWMRYE